MKMQDNVTNENAAPEVNSIIVEEYLRLFSPAQSYAPGVMIRTTADIISDLSDMADLTPEEVNAIMIKQKFRPGVGGVIPVLSAG